MTNIQCDCGCAIGCAWDGEKNICPQCLFDRIAELEKVIESMPYPVSPTKCDRCAGPVYDFTVSNDLWNHVVRKDGPETYREYLCLTCFHAMVADRITELEAIVEKCSSA